MCDILFLAAQAVSVAANSGLMRYSMFKIHKSSMELDSYRVKFLLASETFLIFKTF